MPNIKSQKKRAVKNLKENAAHRSERSALKTAIKKVNKAIELKDQEAAKAALSNAVSFIDKAVTDGIHHKNWAARQKSRLTKAVNNIQ